ncbi:MAG: 2OG-Fe(II) oxygenase [Gammaproteobacteria bacterium]|nr:2OG-Fe(II) oxygenase [Gammaproteobacteria bacterium]
MLPVHPYWWFKSAISPADCQRIMARGLEVLEQLKQSGGDATGVTLGATHKGAENAGASALADRTLEDAAQEIGTSQQEATKGKYIRDSEVCFLNDAWIYDLVFPLIAEANQRAGWNYEVDFAEPFQFAAYRPGGFYGWHTDGFTCHFGAYQKFEPGVTPLVNGKPPPNCIDNPKMLGKVRKLSMTLNLNEPGAYEGGNLKFDFGPHVRHRERYHECEEIRPQGSMIVFPSYVYHQVTPVTAGIRYSLVLWVLGKPFR